MSVSVAGTVVAALVLLPNLLLLRLPGTLPDPPRRLALRVSTVLERLGQVGCLGAAVLAPGSGTRSWPWAVLVALLVSLYVGRWVVLVTRGADRRELYAPWGVIPVPMAVVPVLVFALTAMWLHAPWLAVASGALALGHIPVSLAVARACRSTP
ncbi:hypothetical protein [Microbacterium binotii]|uniref:hypothetical protein n=1 Tax=Microbacterium binotii TaxID=462710 RepID=UPI001F2B8D2E|nr:hypothetical protein [Microbacterium binotii]UIN29527.1 hypothetical protein LXM64_10195 [Microbacterium binotii]